MRSRPSGTGYTAAELVPWAARVQALLEATGGRYALIGGAAVMAYGKRARTRALDAGRPRDLRDVEDVLEETAVDLDDVRRLLAPFDLELPAR